MPPTKTIKLSQVAFSIVWGLPGGRRRVVTNIFISTSYGILVNRCAGHADTTVRRILLISDWKENTAGEVGLLYR